MQPTSPFPTHVPAPKPTPGPTYSPTGFQSITLESPEASEAVAVLLFFFIATFWLALSCDCLGEKIFVLKMVDPRLSSHS